MPLDFLDPKEKGEATLHKNLMDVCKSAPIIRGGLIGFTYSGLVHSASKGQDYAKASKMLTKKLKPAAEK